MKAQTQEALVNRNNSVGRMIMVVLSVLLQMVWSIGFAIKLTEYYAAASAILSIVALILIFRIYGRNMNSAMKLTWIVIVAVFPIMGVYLYLLFGHSNASAGMKKKFETVQKEYETMLPQEERTVTRLLQTDKGLANQAYYLRNTVGYPVYQNTDVEFFGDTMEALEAQKEALRSAKKFIFMEYFAIEDATVWQGMEEILEQKVAEGVDVRIAYDDMGSISGVGKAFEERLKEKKIPCKVFNRLVPVAKVLMNYRDHRKITVVDGKVGFTGGYNLENEYFNLTQPYGVWKDSGVRLKGDAVRSLTLIFLEMWNSSQKRIEDPVPFLLKPAYRSAEGGYVIPYADNPLDGERVGENVYLNLIKNARHYVYITTPYLILSDVMQKELTLAAKRGVDVRIITPGIPDKKLVFKATRSYYAGLATEGVRIYEFTPGFIHSKQVVSDDEVAIVGTMNLDFRSLYHNFEDACWFAKCRAVLSVRRDFEKMFPICKEVTEEYCGKRKLTLRGMQCILRLFSPLL